MIRKIIAFFAASLLFVGMAHADDAVATHAKIQTSMGDIIVELYPEEAPITVENFLQYATKGHYDRTLIHRVVHGYVIQGGGYSRLYTERITRDPIPYEGDNGVKNDRGTIAMARGNKPDSAQAQWFINLQDNPKLNHRVTDLGPIYGYTVFGKVVEGMDVVDAIGGVSTGAAGPFDAEVPIDQIFINRIDPIEWPAAE
ncbi:peptidylprolyl isomerase [Hyphococcus sp. DH-69]|uniref:peptidylprolyl isomerase n=1 Tax=Hyphococcus formosus TaxID=3143534 RepID=UPI00398BB5E8